MISVFASYFNQQLYRPGPLIHPRRRHYDTACRGLQISMPNSCSCLKRHRLHINHRGHGVCISYDEHRLDRYRPCSHNHHLYLVRDRHLRHHHHYFDRDY